MDKRAKSASAPKRIPTAWLKRYVTERGLDPDLRVLKRIEVERNVTPTVAFRIYFEEIAPPEVRAPLRNAWRNRGEIGPGLRTPRREHDSQTAIGGTGARSGPAFGRRGENTIRKLRLAEQGRDRARPSDPPEVRAPLRNAYRQHQYRERKAKETEALRNALARAEAAGGADATVLIDPRPFVKAMRPLLREMKAETKKSFAVYCPQTLEAGLFRLEKLIDALESGAPLRNGGEV